MKSTFFHIGVNRTIARNEGLREPYINTDGSIPFIPLPGHHDPDFKNITYGDPWGRLKNFNQGDIAWFIESGTLNSSDWGYYIVAYFIIEDIYIKTSGIWNKELKPNHFSRIAKNAHEVQGDLNYTIVLGEKDSSCLLFENPFRISKAENAFNGIKEILGFQIDTHTRGYWFKTWFKEDATKKLLKSVLLDTKN